MIDVKELLDHEARIINSPDFIDKDPVQFPRRFEKLQDIEIVSLLSSAIAWGNRKMICSNCEKILRLMDYQPHNYVMDKGYEELPDMNIHRTFFAKDMRHFLRGLNRIYSVYGSIAEFAKSKSIESAELPAWKLAEYINQELYKANDGASNSRCLPGNLQTTALKRLNMALRWLVRDDGIVDIGVWKGVLTPAQLYIPLDVHVGNTARELGLLSRKGNDKNAVLQLTERLREMRPDDPVLYDYALFGIGVMGKSLSVRP
ncbi:MAG: TIGR02757 family protein [Muribaculum sp.]|nr:TIGR02757 family protein [Muribaculum sp.]